MNPTQQPCNNPAHISTLTKGIDAFWKQGSFDSFIGVDDITIQYATFIQTTAKESTKTIIVVPGRCEAYVKYKELAYDLFKNGYNIFIIDHRGQGSSQRLLTDLHKGYVVNFQDYVEDLSYFINKIVLNNSIGKPYLLAHSMGGAIATRFMQDSPDIIKAAVLSSPMLGFETHVIPKFIAKGVVSMKLWLDRFKNDYPSYFLGQKEYSPIAFANNRLTHSPERYQAFVDLYLRNKNLQLGGVTTHWLAEGISAQQEIFEKIGQLKTPILMLQAKKDSVVCQTAQTTFCKQLNDIHPYSCPGGIAISFDDSYHEILFEIDKIRDVALDQTLTWFSKHQ